MEALHLDFRTPGFGFRPNDVELISYYLKNKILNQNVPFQIPEVDVYKHDPRDLPEKCNIQTRDNTWHFFVRRDRKYPNSARINRATRSGYWKSTGKDRAIKVHKKTIGMKKTLVFHTGSAPSGRGTEWIIHEYYFDEKMCQDVPDLKDSFVLCRVSKRDDFPEGKNSLPSLESVIVPSDVSNSRNLQPQELEEMFPPSAEFKIKPEEPDLENGAEDETGCFNPDEFLNLSSHGGDENLGVSHGSSLDATSAFAQTTPAAEASYFCQKEPVGERGFLSQQPLNSSDMEELLPVVQNYIPQNQTNSKIIHFTSATSYAFENDFNEATSVMEKNTQPMESIFCDSGNNGLLDDVSATDFECGMLDNAYQGTEDDTDYIFPSDIRDLLFDDNGSFGATEASIPPQMTRVEVKLMEEVQVVNSYQKEDATSNDLMRYSPCIETPLLDVTGSSFEHSDPTEEEKEPSATGWLDDLRDHDLSPCMGTGIVIRQRSGMHYKKTQHIYGRIRFQRLSDKMALSDDDSHLQQYDDFSPVQQSTLETNGERLLSEEGIPMRCSSRSSSGVKLWLLASFAAGFVAIMLYYLAPAGHGILRDFPSIKF